MKALQPYMFWIKVILLLASHLFIGVVVFQAASARANTKLLKLETSVATTREAKKDEQVAAQQQAKIEYVDRVETVVKWKTKKEKEIEYVSQPLAQCVLSDAAVRLYNEARDCSLHSDPARCSVDIEVRAAGTPATKQ